MDKKKILFVMPSMFIGGAERSLLGLLDSFDYERYEVYLFLYRHEGEFLKLLPEKTILLAPLSKYATFDVPITKLLFSRKWLYGIARILSKAAKRFHIFISNEQPGVWMSMQFTSRFLQPLLPKIKGEYDSAICFLGIPDVLINKVIAKKKFCWNHTDYTVLGPNKSYDRKLYRQLDGIVSVSASCNKQFLSFYPEFSQKAFEINNILSPRMIRERAKEDSVDVSFDKKSIILLSIGRFSEAKNFDNIPDICKRVLKEDLNVKWYLIGYGGDEPFIRQKIKEAGMEEHVVILGKKENPYPYIKACDLYVQPSRYEGKCVSVIEAQILGKPVVITDYPTSSSQLENGVDGIIVPQDNEGCARGIAALLKDPTKMERIANNCASRDYSNSDEIKKLEIIL